MCTVIMMPLLSMSSSVCSPSTGWQKSYIKYAPNPLLFILLRVQYTYYIGMCKLSNKKKVLIGPMCFLLFSFGRGVIGVLHTSNVILSSFKNSWTTQVRTMILKGLPRKIFLALVLTVLTAAFCAQVVLRTVTSSKLRLSHFSA